MTDMYPRYVCGFAFHYEVVPHPLIRTTNVLLVRKQRPKWQSGLWNGVGGKIEDSERPENAMAREFAEETGIQIDVSFWSMFAVEKGSDYTVHFFRGFTDKRTMQSHAPKNDVGEILSVWPISVVLSHDGPPIVGNLNWLIPMALDWRKLMTSINTSDEISSYPMW